MRDASKTQEVNESYKTQEVWKVTSCPGSFPRLHKLYNAEERGSPGSTMPPLGCALGCMSCPPHQCGLFSDALANSPLIPKPDLGGIISLVCCQCPACDRHLLVSPQEKSCSHLSSYLLRDIWAVPITPQEWVMLNPVSGAAVSVQHWCG